MDYASVDPFSNTMLSLLFLASNVQGTTVMVILILALLVISYFISGSMVAFFSLTSRDINMLKTKQGTAWKRIVNLLEEPKVLLGSMRIGNTFVNIAIIILSNFLINELMPIQNSFWFFELLLKILIVTFFLILFGEVLPKVYASQNNLGCFLPGGNCIPSF